MPKSRVTVPAGWTVLNSSAVASGGSFQVQNISAGDMHLARGTDSAPAEDAEFFLLAPGQTHDGTLDTAFVGGAGSYVWARAPIGGDAVILWNE